MHHPYDLAVLTRSRRALLLVWLVVQAACSDDATTSSATDAAVDAGRVRPTDQKRDAGNQDSADTDDAGGRGAGGANAAEKPDAALTETSRRPVRLRFRAQVGSEPFRCGQSYAAQGSTRQRVTPQDLRMFMQDVALVDRAGREVAVELDVRAPWQTGEVALLDFEDASGGCFGDVGTNVEITGTVPKGEYRAVRFTNGVPEKLNHSDPDGYPAPLKTPGMSWNWLLGLRFLRFELQTVDQVFPDDDAGVHAPGSFALHLGSVACAGSQREGTIRCSKPNRNRVQLDNYEVDRSTIVIDVSQLLRESDLTQLIECHSATPVCEPMFDALGISYATGQPLQAAAPLYRLE